MTPAVLFSYVNPLMKTQGISEILNMEAQTESVISSFTTGSSLLYLSDTHLVLPYRPYKEHLKNKFKEPYVLFHCNNMQEPV